MKKNKTINHFVTLFLTKVKNYLVKKNEPINNVDPLFHEVAQFVMEKHVTSISGIQRRFSLGFNRAEKIVEQLEAQGILSAPDVKGKREVLSNNH